MTMSKMQPRNSKPFPISTFMLSPSEKSTESGLFLLFFYSSRSELEVIAGNKDNVFLGADTYTQLLQKINPCGDRAVVQEEETPAPSVSQPPQAYGAPVASPQATSRPPSIFSPETHPPTLSPTPKKTTTHRPATPFTVKPHPVGISPFICNPNDPTVVNCKDRMVFEKKVDNAGRKRRSIFELRF